MTAVRKVGRQDSANAEFRSKLEKSIIQLQLTFCSYFFLYTQHAVKNKRASNFWDWQTKANNAPAQWANQRSDAVIDTLLKRQHESGSDMPATMCDNKKLLQ